MIGPANASAWPNSRAKAGASVLIGSEPKPGHHREQQPDEPRLAAQQRDAVPQARVLGAPLRPRVHEQERRDEEQVRPRVDQERRRDPERGHARRERRPERARQVERHLS
jgi:hypothetical protein